MRSKCRTEGWLVFVWTAVVTATIILVIAWLKRRSDHVTHTETQTETENETNDGFGKYENSEHGWSHRRCLGQWSRREVPRVKVVLWTEARGASLQEDSMRMLREWSVVLAMDNDCIGCEQRQAQAEEVCLTEPSIQHVSCSQSCVCVHGRSAL